MHNSSNCEVSGMCNVVKSSPPLLVVLVVLLMLFLGKCLLCVVVLGEVGGFFSGWNVVKNGSINASRNNAQFFFNSWIQSIEFTI